MHDQEKRPHKPMKSKNERILELIENYGSIDGAHHKQWVIDQIARVLMGAGYLEWVKKMKTGENGEYLYYWDEGIAP